MLIGAVQCMVIEKNLWWTQVGQVQWQPWKVSLSTNAAYHHHHLFILREKPLSDRLCCQCGGHDDIHFNCAASSPGAETAFGCWPGEMPFCALTLHDAHVMSANKFQVDGNTVAHMLACKVMMADDCRPIDSINNIDAMSMCARLHV